MRRAVKVRKQPELKQDQQHAFNAAKYYQLSIDPFENFNQVEITLSHLFRKPSPLLGGRTYGNALHSFFRNANLLREEIIEVGGGLGDVMRCLLDADKLEAIRQCRMIDISERLISCQRRALEGVRGIQTSWVLGDCESLSQGLSDFNGLLLCNGVIADLTSHLINGATSIKELLGHDPEIAEFARGRHPPYYLPTGSLRFLKELRKSFLPEACAVITEYQATDLNQPSWFDNHYECGIDFSLLQEFADCLGFSTTLLDLPGIIGFDDRTALLSMDIFTMRDALTFDVPSVAELARLPEPLPVAAYTARTLADVLHPHLGSEATERVVHDLEEWFHPVAAIAFDTKNPTTWSYKALVLRS